MANHDFGLDEINENEISAVKIQALRKILSEILIDRTSINCEWPGKLKVRGEFVRFSDVVRTSCPEKITCIDVFAARGVFIDASFTGYDEFRHLSIVAPAWEVVGLQRINLDGKHGAELGVQKAGMGASGAPGLPGGPAASFYGVGENFINRVQLSVSANGGKGGQGQNGGGDAAGNNGWDANGDGDYNHVNQGGAGAKGCSGSSGGRGGLGGQGGEVAIMNFGDKLGHGINLSNTAGKIGDGSEGGFEGNGGKSGRDCRIGMKKKRFLGMKVGNKKNVDCWDTNRWAEQGDRGWYGVNTEGQEWPQHWKSCRALSEVLKDYRNYFLESRFENRKFLDALEGQIPKDMLGRKKRMIGNQNRSTK